MPNPIKVMVMGVVVVIVLVLVKNKVRSKTFFIQKNEVPKIWPKIFEPKKFWI